MAGTFDDEQTLITSALGGSLTAFNALVLRYQGAVYTVTYRIMGEPDGAADATQETFLTAYRKLNTYQGGVFRAWLLRIATNTCYDLLRYHKRRPATALDELPGGDTDDGPPLPAAEASPEERAEQAELSRAIQNCISGLQADQRVAIVMSDIEGYSYQEIADATEVQLGTVKSRISRARAGLRHCLEAVRELLPAEYRLSSDD